MAKFPKGFLFGSATSAHQTEGHQNNDWARWEKIPKKIENGDSSEIAADSWNKWREDIELLKNSGQNAYRFSIEWSRIEPEEGKFSKSAIEHYREIIFECKRNKIEPMITLFHFTSPLWIDDIGGWRNRRAAVYFVRFAVRMAEEYGNAVMLWSVINEPTVYANTGYVVGNWYPGLKRKYFDAIKVFFNLIYTQKQIYLQMKRERPQIQIGIAHHMIALLPAKNRWYDRALTKIARYFVNELPLDLTQKYFDFVGINHYYTYFLGFHPKTNVNQLKGADKYIQPVRPIGIYEVIAEASKYKKPIYITENGLASIDANLDDKARQEYIGAIFAQLAKALAYGADLRGYFYWSLLDNFEWSSGYTIRFGLHTIDRKPKGSAKFYKDLIKSSCT